MAASNAEVEAESTVSDSSGITRVPKSVRQELDIDRGDVLQFVVTSSGDVVLTKKEQ
jgi:bifunctional DNA-binding transcriptional regulator/antitoxin component of YhaV-PrlF toxin-antitoxin module